MQTLKLVLSIREVKGLLNNMKHFATRSDGSDAETFCIEFHLRDDNAAGMIYGHRAHCNRFRGVVHGLPFAYLTKAELKRECP